MFYDIRHDRFGFFLFVRGYERRQFRPAHARCQRRCFATQPTINVGQYIPDITAAEIGQILGGN